MPPATDILLSQLALARLRVADLAREQAALEASTAEGPDDEHDAEGSTVGYERARVSALLARSRAAVAALEAASARVDDGSYGRCAGCGAPVGDERLAALPSTTRCVACAGGRGCVGAGGTARRGPSRPTTGRV